MRTRWASLNKSVKKIVEGWDALVAASEVQLDLQRASQSAVREALGDPLLLTKLVFLREFSRKMLDHIKYFESNKVRAHEVYMHLVAVQHDMEHLFGAAEIEAVLTIGRCPEFGRAVMTEYIRVVSRAAHNDWLKKMRANQDSETIELYQMIAVFDPMQKAAFTFTTDEILDVIRPITNSIYSPDPGYDPLRVRQFTHPVVIVSHSPQTQLQDYLSQHHAQLNGTVWDYWVAKKAMAPHLGSTVLALLAAPIGNAEVERSLRKIKKTSLLKERSARMTPENKKMVDFIYVNSHLDLTSLRAMKEKL